MTGDSLSPALALVILAGFGLLWVAAGWWLGRHNRSLEDYMLAGRSVGLAMATATAMATWVTSNTTMTAPQLTYQLGIWGMVGYSLGAIGLLLFAPLAERIRRVLPQGFTSGDFIRVRYGTLAWRVFLLISLLYALGWLISLGMAGGILVSALSGLDYHVGMSLILLICVSYTLLGGLKAVIATDFVQTLIILVGLVIVAVLLLSRVDVSTLHADLAERRPLLVSLLFPAAIMFLFNNLLFGVGEIFHSNVWWSRAFAFRDKVGGRAFLLAGLCWLPVPIVAGFVALAAPTLGIDVPSADMVGPLVAGHLLGYAGAVLTFVVVFAALASSLDSLLAATADLITQDVYRGHFRPAASDAELLRASRYVILGLGLFAWLFCLPRLTTLAELLYFTGAFVASTIWPIVFGLYYRWPTGRAAGLAMLAGSGLGLLAYFQIGFYVAALVSCAASLLVMAGAGLLTRGSYDFDALSRKEGLA